MIAYLRGVVVEKYGDSVVLDVHGVGYGVHVAHRDFGSAQTDGEMKLYIYEQIREDAHELFGFTDTRMRNLFQLLIGVNGVGPKMGLSLLNIGTSEEIVNAIAAKDTKYLTAASGVGKKVAERIVIELKDKVVPTGIHNGSGVDQFVGQQDVSGPLSEAALALVGLGYSQNDARELLNGVDQSASVENQIREALKRR